jgi:rhodanese-related sulfurtransferase
MSEIAGEITPQQAWELLQKEPRAVLVDVRSDAEWRYSGLPDLRGIGKQPALVTLQRYPTGEPNPAFLDELKATGAAPGDALLFICRSGARSHTAAKLATAAGLGPCYNVLTGFEGPRDPAGHRGTISGWKHDGLPWVQE